MLLFLYIKVEVDEELQALKRQAHPRHCVPLQIQRLHNFTENYTIFALSFQENRPKLLPKQGYWFTRIELDI